MLFLLCWELCLLVVSQLVWHDLWSLLILSIIKCYYNPSLCTHVCILVDVIGSYICVFSPFCLSSFFQKNGSHRVQLCKTPHPRNTLESTTLGGQNHTFKSMPRFLAVGQNSGHWSFWTPSWCLDSSGWPSPNRYWYRFVLTHTLSGYGDHSSWVYIFVSHCQNPDVFVF